MPTVWVASPSKELPRQHSHDVSAKMNERRREDRCEHDAGSADHPEHGQGPRCGIGHELKSRKPDIVLSYLLKVIVRVVDGQLVREGVRNAPCGEPYEKANNDADRL